MAQKTHEIRHECDDSGLTERRKWLASNLGPLGERWDHDPLAEITCITVTSSGPTATSFDVHLSYKFFFDRIEDATMFNMVWG
jgi:hypothetical protein